jgi:dimethylhistidine N-methyltransferase
VNSVFIAELGSGGGQKTRVLLQAIGDSRIPYYPIDVSRNALERCFGELDHHADVRPVQGSYLDGLRRVVEEREGSRSMLLLFLGSTIGNFDSSAALVFLRQVRELMLPGDHLLIGADLVKPVSRMLIAYDDPCGVTAAFNRNVLARMNRELSADFDLRAFDHEVRWNESQKRIEMHLRSRYRHTVGIPRAGIDTTFVSGETIWTESSHKFTVGDLQIMADVSGFRSEACWVANDWPFAECLWGV